MMIERAPLRVSLFGGGSDFPEFFGREGGAALTGAIDRYVYVTLSRRWDPEILLAYRETEVVQRVPDLKHDLVREAMLVGPAWVRDGHVEVHIVADVPGKGSGLGSSGALAVALTRLFLGDVRVPLRLKWSPTALPEDAPPSPSGPCLIWGRDKVGAVAAWLEIKLCGRAIGVQDQLVSAKGGAGLWQLAGEYGSDSVFFPLPPEISQLLSDRLLLFHVGEWRGLSATNAEYRNHLCAGDEGALYYARWGRDMAESAHALLTKRPETMDEIGQMLDDGWQRKRRIMPGSSGPGIDALYAAAMLAGALGGKMCGEGGGGFMLLYVRPEDQEAVRAAMRDPKVPELDLAKPFRELEFTWGAKT
jgi:D-glycero-alpha-D-manno-heptose-7-phosphate kinase